MEKCEWRKHVLCKSFCRYIDWANTVNVVTTLPCNQLKTTVCRVFMIRNNCIDILCASLHIHCSHKTVNPWCISCVYRLPKIFSAAPILWHNFQRKQTNQQWFRNAWDYNNGIILIQFPNVLQLCSEFQLIFAQFIANQMTNAIFLCTLSLIFTVVIWINEQTVQEAVLSRRCHVLLTTKKLWQIPWNLNKKKLIIVSWQCLLKNRWDFFIRNHLSSKWTFKVQIMLIERETYRILHEVFSS